MLVSVADVAWIDLCVRATLMKKKLSDLEDVPGMYDEMMDFARDNIGRHEIKDDNGKRLSALTIEKYVRVLCCACVCATLARNACCVALVRHPCACCLLCCA